jgi:hypothetical protein
MSKTGVAFMSWAHVQNACAGLAWTMAMIQKKKNALFG